MDLHIQSNIPKIANFVYTVLQRNNLSPRFFSCSNAIIKTFQTKNISYTWKNFSVADILGRSFTNSDLQFNQLKHNFLSPQIDFAVFQINNTWKPVHYINKHEEVLHIQDMILTLILLIMAQIKIQYKLMIKVTMLLLNF